MWHRQERATRTREPGTELRSILVPVDGSPASLQAVEFACTMAKRAKGRVNVVHVIEVKRSLPLDAELVNEALRGEEILDLAERTAKRLDFDIEGELLQARDAGHAIIDEAVERRVDVIVMGVAFRRPYGDFELGRVASHVLKSAPCEVILIRLPAQD